MRETTIIFSNGHCMTARSLVDVPEFVFIPAIGKYQPLDRSSHPRTVTLDFKVTLTPYGQREVREIIFYGKHLPPAPPAVEAWLKEMEIYQESIALIKRLRAEILEERRPVVKESDGHRTASFPSPHLHRLDDDPWIILGNVQERLDSDWFFLTMDPPDEWDC